MKKIVLMVVGALALVGCTGDPCFDICKNVREGAERDACIEECASRPEPGWGHVEPAASALPPI